MEFYIYETHSYLYLVFLKAPSQVNFCKQIRLTHNSKGQGDAKRPDCTQSLPPALFRVILSYTEGN